MPAIPSRFRAYLVEQDDAGFRRGLRDLAPDQLDDGEVEIRIEWSGVNYKDGLAATPDGRVARRYPLVPGIDLAGTVVASASVAFHVGEGVIAHGHDLGVAHHGGYAEFARVPADWVFPLPPGMDARTAMAFGTAGFTAGLSVVSLEERGLDPADGPVLVTGATGGVGSLAVSMLAARGYEVWAMTGKREAHAWLTELGAAGILGREDAPAAGRPLESERWAGAVDTVGEATLPYVLRTLRKRAAVAACGNASGARLETTVFPFILRGVALLGMDSAWQPMARRRRIWDRLATDLMPPLLLERTTTVELDGLEGALDAIVRGEARGRWLVRVGG
jgi:acrylyl-CoA reductase (NADPH)